MQLSSVILCPPKMSWSIKKKKEESLLFNINDKLYKSSVQMDHKNYTLLIRFKNTYLLHLKEHII